MSTTKQRNKKPETEHEMAYTAAEDKPMSPYWPLTLGLAVMSSALFSIGSYQLGKINERKIQAIELKQSQKNQFPKKSEWDKYGRLISHNQDYTNSMPKSFDLYEDGSGRYQAVKRGDFYANYAIRNDLIKGHETKAAAIAEAWQYVANEAKFAREQDILSEAETENQPKFKPVIDRSKVATPEFVTNVVKELAEPKNNTDKVFRIAPNSGGFIYHTR